MNIILSARSVHPETKKSLMKQVDKLNTSRNTIKRKIAVIGDYLEEKLIEMLKGCLEYSIAIDESVDVNDIAQITIFVRITHEDLETSELFFKLKSLYQSTKAEDIFNAVTSIEIFEAVGYEKLGTITSDAGRDKNWVHHKNENSCES